MTRLSGIIIQWNIRWEKWQVSFQYFMWQDTAREVAQLEEQLERSRDSCEKSMRDRKQHEGRLEETQRKLKETKLV